MSRIGVAAITALLLSGCGQGVDNQEEIRPVRVQRVTAVGGEEETVYSGEVRARYETRLAFRVPGKIVSRDVEVGQTVKRGQVLARLDARDLELSEAAAQAQVLAASEEHVLADAELKRYQELRRKNFISQAELERRASASATAEARHRQTSAQLRHSGNQSSYAALLADTDGVITAIDAEAGQVVAAGQTVVRLARLEEKEVAISVPEQRVGKLAQAVRIQVRLWANPLIAYTAKIREIAPASDPVTRTYPVRIALTDADEHARLGMTASVIIVHADGAPRVRIPLTALYEKGGKPAVWVVDSDKRTVDLVPVKGVALSGNDFLVDAGLASGQFVATGGVHLLRQGQKVRLLETPR